ncbi:hypothetical protein [Methylomonas sp. MgM2]
MSARLLKTNKPRLENVTHRSPENSSTALVVSIRSGSMGLKELEEKEAREILAEIPKDVGWFLLIGGLATEFGVPGVPPIWIAGIMILWPSAGERLSATIQRRAPKSFNGCLRMLCRYVHDLEQRYPRDQN